MSAQPTRPPRKAQDRIGERHERLTVRAVICRPGKRTLLECDCACGRQVTIELSNLKTTKSCGCWRREVSKERGKTHGLSGMREWTIWKDMTRRCRNPRGFAPHRYIGRGIKVCEHWLGCHGFANFLADVGAAPSPKHSIDRKDNDGHYSCGHCWQCLAEGWPANCRWATRKEQMRNTCRSVRLTFRGETRQLSEWAELTGIPYGCLKQRVARGWPAEDTLTLPSDSSRRRGCANGQKGTVSP